MKKIITALMSVLMVVTLAIPVFATDRTTEEIVTDIANSIGDQLYYDHTGLYLLADSNLGSLLNELQTDGVYAEGANGYKTTNVNLGDEISQTDSGYKISLDPGVNSVYADITKGETITLYVANDIIVKTFVAPEMDYPKINITYNYKVGETLIGTKVINDVPVGLFYSRSVPSKGKCSEIIGGTCPLENDPNLFISKRAVFDGVAADDGNNVDSYAFEFDVPNNDVTITFYYEHPAEVGGSVTFGESEGLVVNFAEDRDLYLNLISMLILDNAGISSTYDQIKLELVEDGYKAEGTIFNCIFDYGTGKIENKYIESNIENKSVKVSLASLKELGVVNGTYKVSLSKYGDYLDTYELGTVDITGCKDIHEDDRVDSLHVVLGENFKAPIVGEDIPYEIEVEKIYGIKNGVEVSLEDEVYVEWAKKSPYKLGDGSDWYTSALHEPYYDEVGNVLYRSTPKFDSNSYYYIAIQYGANQKEYGNTPYSITIDGVSQEVNGNFVGKGAGGPRLSYFYVDFTMKYSTIAPFGYAQAKNTVPADITAQEQSDLDIKMGNMFEPSSSAVSSTEQLSYVNDNNKAGVASASSNIQAVVGAGGKIEIGLRESTAQKVTNTSGGTSVVVTSMSFDVTPTTSSGETKHGNVGTTVTFRLPVDKDADFTYANVTHEGSFLQQCEVKTAADGSKYIEVSSNQFSVFGYTLTNTRYVAPSGGSGSGSSGSTITRKPVVNTSAK